jgi:hypothetical protein
MPIRSKNNETGITEKEINKTTKECKKHNKLEKHPK